MLYPPYNPPFLAPFFYKITHKMTKHDCRFDTTVYDMNF